MNLLKTTITTENQNSSKTISEFPHLNDILLTLDCLETEWILIFAFYQSSYGQNTFTRDQVMHSYKEERGTPTRSKNFAANWNSLIGKYIRTKKDDEFIITPNGREFAHKLIFEEISAGSKTRNTKATRKREKSEIEEEPVQQKKAKKTTSKGIVVEPFDLHKAHDRASLEEFIAEKQPKSTAYIILVIAYYITKLCKKEVFSDGNIDYAYKVLQIKKRPTHLHQIIINAKNQYMWFEESGEHGKWKLSRPGEIFVEEKLP